MYFCMPSLIEGLSPYVRLDQHFVGGGWDCDADAEERAESGVAGATAIETDVDLQLLVRPAVEAIGYFTDGVEIAVYGFLKQPVGNHL